MTYQKASQDHVVYCFDVLIHSYGRSGTAPAVLFAQAHCPLFVTWSKVSRFGDYRLRGCIGTLQPRHLHTALREYALTSALKDKRFPPIAENELSQLRCTVSFLHTSERAAGWQDWEIGTHGLIIEFSDPHTHERRSATYLPEIAAAEGWTKQGTIDSLVRKAGFNGHVSHGLREGLTITKYQSTAYMMTHTEYLAANTVPVDSTPAVGKVAAIAVQA
ncbi:hypothetical protein WJX77_002866 [Trebouxia sp. C0004]